MKSAASEVGSDKVWSRRYTLIVISDEEWAQVERFRYVVANGCKEGLVQHVKDWPGVHVAPYLLDEQNCEGTWFDRTQETCARWRGESFESRRFASRETVKLSPLPCWRHLTAAKRRQRIADIIADIEADAAREHELSGRPPKGVQEILTQDPLRRPAKLKRSPAPLFHAATKRVRRELYDAYALFLAAYREAAEKLRSGVRTVVFPTGCFPPALPFASG